MALKFLIFILSALVLQTGVPLQPFPAQRFSVQARVDYSPGDEPAGFVVTGEPEVGLWVSNTPAARYPGTQPVLAQIGGKGSGTFLLEPGRKALGKGPRLHLAPADAAGRYAGAGRPPMPSMGWIPFPRPMNPALRNR